MLPVGSSPLARDFFAGRYAQIAAEAFDREGAPSGAADVAFVVGALTFVGRLDDARLAFDAWRLKTDDKDPRTLAASHFFLGLADVRSGDFEGAHRLLVHDARARSRSDDPWISALVFQGLACYRHFTGRYRAAARHALRALRAAHVAQFAYAKMLATDLRGHALVQVGAFRSGISLLEQAKRHAKELGFDKNAYAIDCSIASYSASFVAQPSALQRIEHLVGKRAHDSYSKRTLQTELAIQLALRGRRSEATRELEAAEHDAARQDTRRGKITTLLARLHVARFAHGAAACAELLPQVASLLEVGDVAFRAELLGFEVFVARAQGDLATMARALAALREMTRTHEHYQARAALEQFDDASFVARPFPEDELTPLLHAVVARDLGVLPKLLALGLLGPIPELLAFVPGRRVVVLVHENALLLEDHGDVRLRATPPRWCPTLLRALAGGHASKEALTLRLWGLRSYRPERHDPLIRTTIHRLRALLHPFGHWIAVKGDGYGATVPIHFVGSPEELDHEVPFIDDALPDAPRAPITMLPAAAAAEETNELLAKVAQLGPCSVRQLSRATGLSQSTVLRGLRELVGARKVIRTGVARATRYQARA